MIEAGLNGVGLYLAGGAIFALICTLFFLPRLDHAAKGAGLGFKVLIFPSILLLWPFLLLFLAVGRQVNKDIHAKKAGKK